MAWEDQGWLLAHEGARTRLVELSAMNPGPARAARRQAVSSPAPKPPEAGGQARGFWCLSRASRAA